MMSCTLLIMFCCEKRWKSLLNFNSIIWQAVIGSRVIVTFLTIIESGWEPGRRYVICNCRKVFHFFCSKICVGAVDGDTATTEAVPDPLGKGHKATSALIMAAPQYMKIPAQTTWAFQMESAILAGRGHSNSAAKRIRPVLSFTRLYSVGLRTSVRQTEVPLRHHHHGN